jgi:hypothetical protein
LFTVIRAGIRTLFMTKQALLLENLALRQQLAAYRRTRIPRRHIEFIKRMSADNPGWGENRVALELRLKLRVERSTSTIRRYMVRSRDPRSGYRWRTFIQDHGEEIVRLRFPDPTY